MTVVTSTANAAVKAARKLARPGSAGPDFLVEGPQAAREAGGMLRRLFVTEAGARAHPDLVDRAAAAGASVVTVSDAVLASLATTVTPQGVVGVATLPEADLTVLREARLAVVADRVADPGNAGTIIRTADALGADAVVLTEGSVSPTNPKAVRASAGSVFHLPVVRSAPLGSALEACRAAGLRLVAVTGDGAVAHTELDLTARVALVFGNEAHGLQAEARSACEASARVVMHPGGRPGYPGSAESLNVAAAVAVVLGEAARQRGAHDAAEDTPHDELEQAG